MQAAGHVLLPAEIAIAVSLLLVWSLRIGAVAALVLLIVFSSAMLWQLWQGRAPDCHCFGQLHSEPVGAKSLLRNAVLIILAAAVVFGSTGAEGADLFDNGLGTDHATKRPSQNGWTLLEMTSGQGGPVERNDAGDPSDGLPIGAPLPDFAIPGLDGRVVQFEHLIADDKPFLFLFVGAECAPCEQLIPEMREWLRDLGEKVRFIIVSHGDISVNARKFGDLGVPVLIERSREFANSVHAKWTPSVLFVDKEGNIASHLAAGDVAIRRLIEKMKLKDLNAKFVYFLGLTGQKRPDIGTEVPEFAVSRPFGHQITKADLVCRRTLAAFISTTCGHCSRLVDEIREWENRGGDNGLGMIVFSDGSKADGRDFELNARLIVDKDYKLAAKLGMRGVPSAVLIDEAGVIVTEAAIGPENIWSLIGGRPE
ncbi:MAG: redoxin domain-containing protein [Chloracidobacterium sp.]|nr:redoxin domain-containing protein [Chloracidobacterium sp.]